MVDYNIQLVDVPRGKIDCLAVFEATMAKAPAHIAARPESLGSNHTDNGTSWAGSYDTYEIYDIRRPDWPTEDAERWRQEVEWSIIEYLNQKRELKIR